MKTIKYALQDAISKIIATENGIRTEEVLNKLDISLIDEDGAFKDLKQILEEISQKYWT